MRIGLTTAALAAMLSASLLSGSVSAATPQQSKMSQCATQWSQMKAANKTGGQTYKAFSAQCMKTAAPAPVAAAAVATPASATTGKQAQNDKMKNCAAQWNTMKASNKTGGKTYKEFSAQCLKK